MKQFDPVCVGHFKCDLRRLIHCLNLWGFTGKLYEVPGVPATVNLDHITPHYHGSHRTSDPIGVVPLDPEIDSTLPYGRGCRVAGGSGISPIPRTLPIAIHDDEQHSF